LGSAYSRADDTVLTDSVRDGMRDAPTVSALGDTEDLA
jgi:hypothetical protein